MASMDDLPKELSRICVAHKGAVLRTRFSNGGNYCMSAGHDKRVILWNPHRDGPSPGKALLVKSYEGVHSSAVNDVCISNDNTQFASGGRDKTVLVWDVSTGKVLRRCYGHDASVNTVVFNQLSNLLFSTSDDTTVQCWDLRARPGPPLQIFSEATDNVTSVDIHQSGYNVITGSLDGAIRIYDIRKGVLNTDQLHSPITSVALSHNGDCVLAACMNDIKSSRYGSADNVQAPKTTDKVSVPSSRGVVRLLEWESGEQLNTYFGHHHAEYPIQCGFSGSDACVYAGDEAGVVRFWSFLNGSVELTNLRHLEYDHVHQNFFSHAVIVCGVEMCSHPTQPCCATSCFDGTVRIWYPTKNS